MDSILKGQGPLEESLIIKGQFKLDPGQVGDAGFRVLGNTRGISKTPIKLIKDLLLLIFKPHLGPNVPTAFIPQVNHITMVETLSKEISSLVIYTISSYFFFGLDDFIEVSSNELVIKIGLGHTDKVVHSCPIEVNYLQLNVPMYKMSP